MTLEEQRTEALQRLGANLDLALEKLGHKFTFQEFRQRITQLDQPAYIDLLGACRDYEKPFGQAHWFLAEHFRPILTGRYGFERTEHSYSPDEKNIFGEPAELITYEQTQ